MSGRRRFSRTHGARRRFTLAVNEFRVDSADAVREPSVPVVRERKDAGAMVAAAGELRRLQQRQWIDTRRGSN
ncbi:MAG TPA: hypothetical protein VNA31_10880, partial [bacterium]|nr:hypothetical protein [bacterium]